MTAADQPGNTGRIGVSAVETIGRRNNPRMGVFESLLYGQRCLKLGLWFG